MNNISIETDSAGMELVKMEDDSSSKGKAIATGVATAIVASTIIQTGKGVMAALARQPVILFSLGVVMGYFVHKHRKSILSLTKKTADESKDFMLKQKEHIKDLLAECHEKPEDVSR